MKTRAEKIDELLRSKCALLEDIGVLLREQETCLDKKQLKAVSSKCREVDTLIKKLESIDHQVTSLEKFVGNSDPQKDIAQNESTARLTVKISRQAEENKHLMDKLVDRALNGRNIIKKALESTVAAGRITGYRPNQPTRSLYLDKRN